MNKALTFSDVLIIPKYSEITSRKEVDISSSLGGYSVELPIISANMKSITGPSMAIEMCKNGGRGALHRFNTIEQAIEDYKEVRRSNSTCIVSVGVQEEDKERFEKLYEAGALFYVIDIAHGHALSMKNMVKWIRTKFGMAPYIIGGNIATGNAAYDLADWGCNAVKVGIGGGCFVAGTKIKTKNLYKTIESIKIGDMVFTHRGRYKKVVATTSRKEEKEIYIINGEKCTGNHEFYVLNRKYKSIVTDDNIDEYAEWIPANKISKDYILLKPKNNYKGF
jgi:IMP dehydrogenase/GMP reductase